MASSEDIPQIPDESVQQPSQSKEGRAEEGFPNKWLENIVAAGGATSYQEALAEMQHLRDSVVSLESEINQLLERKVEELLVSGAALTNNRERSHEIIKRLVEVYQERPEILEKAEGIDPKHNQKWMEALLRGAEYRATYSFPLRALRALVQHYEDDPMRKEWAMAVLDACLAHSQRSVDALFLNGDFNLWGIEPAFDEKHLNELSRENHDAHPIVRELLKKLTPENAKETYSKLHVLIQGLADSIGDRYPYLQPIDQLSYRYDNKDTFGREAVHVAVHGGSQLVSLGERLKYMLLGDLYRLEEELEPYVEIINSGVARNHPLEADDLERIFPWVSDRVIETYSGRTIEDIEKELREQIKSF